MSEHDDLEGRLPPIVPRIRATWHDGQVVFTFPDQQKLVYTVDQVDGIYTMLYQHRQFLSGSSFSILQTPDRELQYRLSGEGGVLLLADLRTIRHQLGIADPSDDPFLTRVRGTPLTPNQVIAEHQWSWWKKTGSTRIKKLLTQADVDAEPDRVFYDLEGRKHEVVVGRCICIGSEGERWTCSIASVDRDRYPIGEQDEHGYQEYKMKQPRPLRCFDISFPFTLVVPGKVPWSCQDVAGAIITWNGEVQEHLDMRIIQRSIFEKTYERA